MRIEILLITCLCLLTFQGVAQYTLQGDAVSGGGNCYVLTDSVGGQVGAVWYDELINLEEAFDLQFKMNFGDNPNGADGMVFVMQTQGPLAIGNTGDGIGFEGFTPSLGIEFDTYWNQSNGDILEDHIGIISDGSVSHLNSTAIAGPVAASSIGADIEDGNDHSIQITWDPVLKEIKVFFDCEFRLVASVDLINYIFGGETSVTWGFTSSTGGANNVHTVCLYENATPSGDVILCPGQSSQLISGGDLSMPFTWVPSDFLSDPNAYNPIATPPFTQIYTVTYTDFCGNTQSDEIEVVVEPLEVNISADFDIITCNNTTVNLTANTNFTSGISYIWEATGGGSFSSTFNENSYTSDAGIYVVQISFDDGACTAEDSYTLDLDTMSFSANTGSDGLINCYEPSYILQGSSNSTEAEFNWSTNNGSFFGASNIAEPTVIEGGLYELEVTNPTNGCVSTNQVIVVEDFTEPVLTVGFPDGIINCEFLQVMIIGSSVSPSNYTNQVEWTWNDGEGNIINPNDINPIATLPGEYYLTVTFLENGCTTSSNEAAIVEQDGDSFIDISQLTMPNVITPNGDYYNDNLKPFLKDRPEITALSVLDEYRLSVYNRWGDLVFGNNGLPLAWDGRANGSRLSPGKYLIVVNYKSVCGEVQTGTYTGPLEILYSE
ncbi:MAG: hypothetical protein COA49_01510 [Bacteroidetes bacterium]|nr:MAG: hypothetical protein COA49_01510 [Bacteroidota bacterium]